MSSHFPSSRFTFSSGPTQTLQSESHQQTLRRNCQKFNLQFNIQSFHSILFIVSSLVTAPESGNSPWLTAKRSFCMTARFPLTLYNPSIHRPAGDDGRKTHQFSNICKLFLYLLSAAEESASPYMTLPVLLWGSKTCRCFTTGRVFLNQVWWSDTDLNPPLFSTWSMHILTKLGTVLLSLWHKLDRLQPNTWSEDTQTKKKEVTQQSKVLVLLQYVLSTLRSLQWPANPLRSLLLSIGD